MRSMRSLSPRAVALLTLIAHAASCSRGEGKPTEGYVTIAEALTADSAGGEMHVARRMFSAPDMAALCANAGRVARLDAVDSVTLRVTEPFPLTTLRIVALDSARAVVPRVPVAIEVEAVSSSVLDLSASRLERGPIATTTGAFTMRARTVCDGPGIEVAIRALAARR